MEFFLIAVGLLALVGGGEILVRGAVTLAKSLNLSPDRDRPDRGRVRHLPAPSC